MQSSPAKIPFMNVKASRHATRWELAGALFCGAAFSSAEYFASPDGSVAAIFWVCACVVMGGGLMAVMQAAVASVLARTQPRRDIAG